MQLSTHAAADVSDLQKTLPRLLARRGDAASHSCCRRALSQCCCQRDHAVHAATAPRSHKSSAWQCRRPTEHQLPHGNIYNVVDQQSTNCPTVISTTSQQMT